MAVYTLGIWTVRPGAEDDFVAAWREMANNTTADFPSATAMLLHDRDRPNLFISYGPWRSLAEIESWRGSAVFRDGVARIRASLESFEPHTMDPVVTIDPGEPAPVIP
ncbi:MAG TPA: antibiotic biosynthesis monooxygenase family protein [Blastococcus sp.]|nr:antibiotic biosynthesis monooxygenase family protein [Blastococcus sp.]